MHTSFRRAIRPDPWPPLASRQLEKLYKSAILLGASAGETGSGAVEVTVTISGNTEVLLISCEVLFPAAPAVLRKDEGDCVGYGDTRRRPTIALIGGRALLSCRSRLAKLLCIDKMHGYVLRVTCTLCCDICTACSQIISKSRRNLEF